MDAIKEAAIRADDTRDFTNLSDREIAALTTTATKFYYYHPADRKAAAREALRHYTQFDFYKKEDGSADVALEHIWNVLVGNY